VYEVRLRAADQAFTFVGGHPWPPLPQWGDLHRSQMQAITTVAEQAAKPLIVAGDFNAAPWSYTVRELASASQATPIRSLFEIPRTWRPFPGFGLPIDHVLVSKEWQVIRQEYGAAGGSDHVPIIIDLQLK
jgi:endonuclease/exonuclease/phosphatase (EEP) superfamily protein YafD